MANIVPMALGPVPFSVPTGTFDEVQRSTRWAIDQPDTLEGMGSPVSRGRESDTMVIRGVAFPGFTGTQNSVERLRELGDTGRSYVLVDGDGNLYGNWMVTAVNESRSAFMANGQPRKITYDVTLTYDPLPDLIPL